MTDRLAADGPGTPEGLSRPEFEALRWVVRMNSGEAGQAEQADFTEWCGRAPENRQALAAAYQLWLATGPALRALPPRRSRLRQHWPALALAASLLLLMALGFRTFTGWQGSGAGAQIAQLDDSGGYCRLLLGDGAASFDVTPNPALAGASADETHVRVMDAAFSLKPYAAGVLVTVTDGQVEYKGHEGLRVFSAGQQMSCKAAAHVAFRATPDWHGDRVAALLHAARPVLKQRLCAAVSALLRAPVDGGRMD